MTRHRRQKAHEGAHQRRPHLTACAFGGKMTGVTFRNFRRRTKRPAQSLIAAMAVSLVATCFSAAEMTPEQQVCCASMQHACGEMAIETSCCTGERQPSAGMVAATPASATFAAASPIAVIAALPVPAAPAGVAFVVNAAPVRPPGVPTYLFISAFRI